MMPAQVETLTHYPVKGLSGQLLDKVILKPGQGFPLDRAFGFARPNSGFDPANPTPIPKTKFLVLARDAGLSLLDTAYDESTGCLSIAGGEGDVSFDLATQEGCAAAEHYLSEHLDLPNEMSPTLFTAHPHRFTDVSVVSPQLMNAVSLINRDSVTAFSKDVGQDVSEKRFRANIVFSGLPAFAELDAVDQIIKLGEARLKVVMRTKRCAATEVNLETGERDLKVPQLLHKNYGHLDMGVYAEVLDGGVIQAGDGVEFVS